MNERGSLPFSLSLGAYVCECVKNRGGRGRGRETSPVDCKRQYWLARICHLILWLLLLQKSLRFSYEFPHTHLIFVFVYIAYLWAWRKADRRRMAENKWARRVVFRTIRNTLRNIWNAKWLSSSYQNAKADKKVSRKKTDKSIWSHKNNKQNKVLAIWYERFNLEVRRMKRGSQAAKPTAS